MKRCITIGIIIIIITGTASCAIIAVAGLVEHIGENLAGGINLERKISEFRQHKQEMFLADCDRSL